MNDKIWQTGSPETGFEFEMRSALAWKLIDHFSLIAARDDGEDTTGRRALRLQAPEEVVKRAFEIADAFTDEALRRGELRPAQSPDACAVSRGRFEAIQSQVRWGIELAAKKPGDETDETVRTKLEEARARADKMNELVAAWSEPR